MTKTVRGRDKFLKHRNIINFLVLVFRFIPLRIRIALFDVVKMIKGVKGMGIRYVLLKTLAVNCGDNVSIHPNVYIFRPDKLSIGNNVSIHPLCYIDATGTIEIGDNVSIAHGVTIMSTSHNFNDLEIPIRDQAVLLNKTKISDNVWIGAKATILSGKRINSGSIIAANCVVTKDVPCNVIVGGVPNKIIKQR